MVSIGELLSILLFGAWVYGVIDVITTDRTAVRNLPKWGWILIVVVLFPLGAIAWFAFGRPPRTDSRPRAAFGPPRAAAPRRARQPRVDEEGDIRAHIAERDRLLAQWADEERGKAAPPPDPGA
ncbi:MAG: PLD nuclease N-terminal domain-containing protein [Acidimicrobiales bacterium]